MIRRRAIRTALLLLATVPPSAFPVEAGERSLQLEPGVRVEVFAPHTELMVIGRQGGPLTVRTPDAAPVEVTERGVVVRVHAGHPPTNPPRLEIELPWGHDLYVEAEVATATIEAVRGDVTVRHAEAPLKIFDIVGDIDAFNRNDRIQIEGVDGNVQGESHTHTVTVKDATGSVRARSATSHVRATRCEGKRVELTTVTGHAIYDGPVRPDGHYRLDSHRGEVIVEIPRDSDATLTLTGRREAFDVERALLRSLGQNEAEITVGDGSARIELSSFRGAIRVKWGQVSPGDAP